jgi:hypothetical protein
MADFGTAFGFFGTGVQDLFASQGYSMAAAGYEKAAVMEDVNANLSRASTRIQHAAAQRSIYKALGGQRSDVLGSGFSFSGTAIDLAADSASQGSLAQALIENQGAIETQGYRIQAFTYRQQAAQARQQAGASAVGGFLNIALGIFSLFSDPKLKHNVVKVGETGGIPLYEFSYIGSNNRYRGYMATEIPAEAVTDFIGFKTVTEPFQSVLVRA